jgi:dTMP kinase
MKKQNYKFIVFEGVDGSGKTTLSKKFAEEIGAYWTYPSTPLHGVRHLFRNASLRARFMYYMLGNQMASEHADELLKKQHVVYDRYFYSTFAYHPVEKFTKAIIKNFRKPDYIIHTSADWKTIQKRNTERGSTYDLERLPILKKVQKRFDAYIRGKNVVRIDTSKASIDEAMDIIRKRIKLN